MSGESLEAMLLINVSQIISEGRLWIVYHRQIKVVIDLIEEKHFSSVHVM